MNTLSSITILLIVVSIFAIVIYIFAFRIGAVDFNLFAVGGTEDTPLATAHFAQSGEAVYKLAQKIELRKKIDSSDIEPVAAQLNERTNPDMTLLSLALRVAHPEAAIALLEAGADPLMQDNESGRRNNFFSRVTEPFTKLGPPPGFAAVPALNDKKYATYQDAVDQMAVDLTAGYIASGGDPNVLLNVGKRGDSQLFGPWGARLASMKAYKPMWVLLDAGADPWLMETSEPALETDGAISGSIMYVLAGDYQADATLHQLIDRGYFDNRSQAEIQAFLEVYGGYAQRGDERSLQIKELAKRILKRNPEYDASNDTRLDAGGGEIYFGSARIFQNHYEDGVAGVIPWDEIRSDAVR